MSSLQHIHGGNLKVASEKFGYEQRQFIDFSANINPLGPSPRAMLAMSEGLASITAYPDPDCRELTAALAGYLHIGSDNILFGNGATELIYLLVDVFKYKKALVCAPTFSEYGLAVLSRGGEVAEILLAEEDNFALPVEEIIARLPSVEILFLCNPNNPTGRLCSKQDILRIAAAARECSCMVAVDEAFMDFVEEKDNYSVLEEALNRDNLIVLYSLTKYFGIPGLRLGTAVASREIIARLKAAKDPWSVNTLAQIAGVHSLADAEYIKNTKILVTQEREFLEEALQRIVGLKVYHGVANYLLINIKDTQYTSQVFVEQLGRRGVLVRDCASFKGLGNNYLRVAVKKREDNLRLIEALEDFLRGVVK
ncbi:L-threonine-O-3-phosphate decarboxylase [Desulfofarcimen acetoxidans DSM 771]|uniref:threonine-phosphate decarboxylase n=1 Tax=Desulfofarcimen acetoxidans (strain ATCC 49208 / DSM 771 / KCTC 5769 / VKM B-1644 / 5575) TaxID=485916 RepID=C8W3Q5_DESAS|nr:threonine-phosphate decarboxylase CobD [Desulfofarcimen acetoxidans]ACV63841.1 L-threonine-O-3-phosphate decarboxylase [Desulfofarcimen acetoxidans DSM 771]